MEGGIPPLVQLLEFADTKVQRAAAGALRTLAFKNDENKNQVIAFCGELDLYGTNSAQKLIWIFWFCRL